MHVITNSRNLYKIRDVFMVNGGGEGGGQNGFWGGERAINATLKNICPLPANATLKT